MKTAKLAGLQSALNASSARNAPPITTTLQAVAPNARPTIASSRAGKENIAAWLPVEFKRSIRLVQAQRALEHLSLQDLMAEAFNDLFVKYNVPTVNQD